MAKKKKKKLPKEITGERDSICHKCATHYKGKWPKGHCATIWKGKCDYCEEEASCTSIGDYDWLDVDFSARRD